MTWEKIRRSQRTWVDSRGRERIAWPTIIEYCGSEGPDRASTPDAFRSQEGGIWTISYDPDAVEMLRRTGLLYDERHTGYRAGEIVDNRTAPGA